MPSSKRQKRPMTQADMTAELEAMAARAEEQHPVTNIDKIRKFIEWGNPFHQVFAILAIEKYVENILNNQEKVREDMKHSFLSPELLIECAKEWRKQNPEK